MLERRKDNLKIIDINVKNNQLENYAGNKEIIAIGIKEKFG